MIRYYNTEADYQAASKSSFESEVSLVGASNKVHIDGVNVVVGAKHAKTGSIAVLDGNSALHFIAVDTYNSASFMSNYTVVGVVAVGVDHADYRGKLVLVHKNNTSAKWSAIYSFRLTGYTIDGAAHTGVLNVRSAEDWGTGVSYTINYNASSVDGLIAQLNTYFQNTAPFTTQNWRAVKAEDGGIDLQFIFENYRQSNNSGSAGFSLNGNLLPSIKSTSSMYRRNGARSGEGTISNWWRALAYFRNDNSSTTYNPSSDVTSPKISHPICLPGYLGTSAYQSDHCAALRAIYGPGEEGWLRFMATFLPVLPTNYGVTGDLATYGDGLTNTAHMTGKTFAKQDGSVIKAHPAADYCAAVRYNHSLLGKGAWHLPDAAELLSIMSTIQYGTNGSRNADAVNKALAAIGGSAISNGSNVWSSSRCLADGGWCGVGGGYMSAYGVYGSNLAVPVALIDVSEANSII